MISLINDEIFYDLDLYVAREKEHSSDFSQKNCPKWALADLSQSLLYIRDYFESLHRSNWAPCSYMNCKDIVPITNLEHQQCCCNTQGSRHPVDQEMTGHPSQRA